MEISQDHNTLLTDIARPLQERERGVFWWLGQHTFVVRTGEHVFYIDPWFAAWESRLTPPLLTGKEARHANWVLVTHGHDDHLCPETLQGIVSASPDALFVCPRTEANRMHLEAGVPVERLRPLNAGDQIKGKGVRITAIKSKHEFFDEHPQKGFPYLGYVIEAGGITFYHAGDTIMYEGLYSTLKNWSHFDVMFLPINGRDAERFLSGCLGNLTYQEAAELAGELRPGVVVPSHYDMFEGNQEDPQKFVHYLEAKYPGVRSWVGLPGERVGIY